MKKKSKTTEKEEKIAKKKQLEEKKKESVKVNLKVPPWKKGGPINPLVKGRKLKLQRKIGEVGSALLPVFQEP